MSCVAICQAIWLWVGWVGSVQVYSQGDQWGTSLEWMEGGKSKHSGYVGYGIVCACVGCVNERVGIGGERSQCACGLWNSVFVKAVFPAGME